MITYCFEIPFPFFENSEIFNRIIDNVCLACGHIEQKLNDVFHVRTLTKSAVGIILFGWLVGLWGFLPQFVTKC